MAIPELTPIPLIASIDLPCQESVTAIPEHLESGVAVDSGENKQIEHNRKGGTHLFRNQKYPKI